MSYGYYGSGRWFLDLNELSLGLKLKMRKSAFCYKDCGGSLRRLLSLGIGWDSDENICSQLDLRKEREEPESEPGHRWQVSRWWISPISRAWWVGWTCVVGSAHHLPHLYPLLCSHLLCAFLCDVRSVFDFLCLGFSTCKIETIIPSTSRVLRAAT